MNLLLDLGNSRLKWAQSAAQVWRVGAVAHRGRELVPLLDEAWGDFPAPTRVVAASVAPDAVYAALAQWAMRRWSRPVERIAAQAEQLGVRNCYRDPVTLGADRWAALIGARELYSGSVCVVDCGTAVTLDALSAEGEFLGGAIFPGLALLRDALVRGTERISERAGNDAQCLAHSTADGVAAGTLYGLVGAIERVTHEFELTLADDMQIIITGGDADQVAARMARAARREPDLVLKGLARMVAAS